MVRPQPDYPLRARVAGRTFRDMASTPYFEFKHLSIAERHQLVEDLWDSIAQDANAETLAAYRRGERALR